MLNQTADQHKRRSRNEPTGRDFKCQVCDRTYLSYPAMYTHMKNKHALDPSGGVFTNQSRQRGRPKRNQEFTRIDPTSDLFLKSEGRGGGPNDPVRCFESVFNDLYGNMQSPEPRKYQHAHVHPLNEVLLKYSHDVTPGGPDDQDNPMNGQNQRSFKQISTEIATMSEEWRVMMNADEILALYLRDVSNKTNEMFYRMMVRFVLLYRDCLNEYGWQKRAEAECREAKQTLEEKNITARLATYQEMMHTHEYCSINNAEVGPEICNEFVTDYLTKMKDTGLERLDSIDYTRNLCHWLFINGHTCSKLSMIN